MLYEDQVQHEQVEMAKEERMIEGILQTVKQIFIPKAYRLQHTIEQAF